eukprot:scaffold2051_cov389-Prasinococcus_capsulatus_cf.AAC.13
MIHRLGKEINHPESVYYWAYKNDIPVFCPGITDGSIGDMLYFHSFRVSPPLVVDIVQDIRAMNDQAVNASPRKTGIVILGGGLPKHHICNANLMRNGADFAVYINTAQACVALVVLLVEATGSWTLTFVSSGGTGVRWQ